MEDISTKRKGPLNDKRSPTISLPTSPSKRLKFSPSSELNSDSDVSILKSDSGDTSFPNVDRNSNQLECSLSYDFDETDSVGYDDEDTDLKHPHSDESVTEVNDEQTKGRDRRIRPSSYKAYHRQIEKRRRNRINAMITDVASLVPTCQNVSHKLDKLSVLELAVQHIHIVTQSKKEADSSFQPKMFSDDEMKYLLEQHQKGFLMVCSCDNAQILYVSEAVSSATNYSVEDLVGRSLFDIVDAKDMSTISTVLMSNSSILDDGSSQSKGVNISSAKRSFCFRLKPPNKMKTEPSSDDSYSMPVSCIGFLKAWSPNGNSVNIDEKAKMKVLSCFVGIAKPISHKRNVASPQQFCSKHTADSTYSYVDSRVLPISGYLPQDLIGKCEYKFVHKDDVKVLSETYRLAIQNKHQEKVISDIYRLKLKHGGLLPMRTVAFSLFNPFTKELEFVSHQNFVMGREIQEQEELHTEVIKEIPNDSNQLTMLVEQCEAAGRIHDKAKAEGKLDKEEENNIRKINSIITPLTLNVLRNSGVDISTLMNLLKGTAVKEENCQLQESLATDSHCSRRQGTSLESISSSTREGESDVSSSLHASNE